jgi:monoterpene epsilon-lactone hydrolase
MSPSLASQALLIQYRELAERFAAQPDMSLAAMRDMFESLSERQSEPTDVTYEEVAAGSGRALWVRPLNAVDGRVILYFHGGGYIAHTMSTSRKLIGHLAKATRASALVPDYRLAPEHPFPAQVEDATAAYRWLLDSDVAPASMAFAGESAGGNLALAAVVMAQLEHLPMQSSASLPGSTFSGTPSHLTPIRTPFLAAPCRA